MTVCAVVSQALGPATWSLFPPQASLAGDRDGGKRVAVPNRVRGRSAGRPGGVLPGEPDHTVEQRRVRPELIVACVPSGLLPRQDRLQC
jgi:hypothetical protein